MITKYLVLTTHYGVCVSVRHNKKETPPQRPGLLCYYVDKDSPLFFLLQIKVLNFVSCIY